jgi:putative hydrolase of the HAD superfamily
MKKATRITCLFLDIGGVLLANGWDHPIRKRVAAHFNLDLSEMDDRHHLTFDTYEEGKLTLDEYLGRVVFYQKRSFTRAQFRRFMFAQSKLYAEMIDMITQLKVRHGLKIAVVSNEGRELNDYRIRKYKLNEFVDFFVSSCFVHIRKPDEDMISSGAGHRPSAGWADRLHREHPDVRPNRRGNGNSQHPPHGLQVHVCETGFVRLADWGRQPRTASTSKANFVCTSK